MLGMEVANGVKVPNGVKVANGVKVKLGEGMCTTVSRSYSMISDSEELMGADAAKKRKKAEWSQAEVIREAVSDPVFAAEMARVLLPGLTKCVQEEFNGYRQESTSVVGDVGSDMKAIRKQLEGLKAELIKREWRIDSLTEDIRVTQEKLEIAQGAMLHDLNHLTRATSSSVHRRTSLSGSPLPHYRRKYESSPRRSSLRCRRAERSASRASRHALSPERSSLRQGGHESSMSRASRYVMSPERSSYRRSRNYSLSRGNRYAMSPERSASVRQRDSSASLSRRFHRIVHAPSREFEGGPWDKRLSSKSLGRSREDSVTRNEVTVYQPSTDLSYSPSTGSPRHHLARSKPPVLGPGYGVTEPNSVGEQDYKLGHRHSVGRSSNHEAPYHRSPFS